MNISAEKIKNQLFKLKPLITGRSLRTLRKGQNVLGELMESKHRTEVLVKKHVFDNFVGAWVMPKDERRQGVMLYLHGGGYACGDLEYAVGVGTIFASHCGMRVFCPAYRLAPEHPFPAAPEDCMIAYRYLLDKGYEPSHIVLCGESAGGGLCYALCQMLKQEGVPLPAGIVALSPWTDLTASGESYQTNIDADPTMTSEMLDFYADCYTKNRRHPLVSPIFGDLSSLPLSLIFVGGSEIMRDDAVLLHRRLCHDGSEGKLIITPNRWHGYLLYGLKEDQKDFSLINKFLNQTVSREQKLRWMRLDNAAKIYPVTRRQNWSNMFRLSATLTEKVDVAILRQSLDITLRRFPSMAVRLRRGAFWYYLQQIPAPLEIREESSFPLTPMSKEETRKCALRVIVYERRIAVEIFHSLTDGTGAMVFLKSLVAEYLQQRYGGHISAESGVLGRLEEPDERELEDSFLKYSGKMAADRRERTAWHLSGTREKDDFLYLTCFKLSVKEVLDKAHQYGISLTAFLCAVMMQALQNMQKEQVKDIRRRKPIKVLLPVNLRSLFPSKTLRNFALYTTPEILPTVGEYSFEEICAAVKHRMGLDINPKTMSMRIAANVGSERLWIVRIMPLFIKNFVMKIVFNTVGECKSCLSLSNLGAVRLPEEMMPFVERMDFILGVQTAAPGNCGVLSFKDTLYINFIRNIRESDLEYHFYKVLREMGFAVRVESNQGGKK